MGIAFTHKVRRRIGVTCLTILMLVLGAAAFDTIVTPVSAAPWNINELKTTPAFEWLDTSGSSRTILYHGLSFKGGETRVFAYYSTPETLGAEHPAGPPYPAVVLVHGGGGTAFREWAEIWAGRGYAAIAMDLAGNGLNRERLPDGGPGQGDDTKFNVDAPLNDQWPYHAVANVILAHSLIRSFPEVDADRTAVTGISWGGYLTCIVAGLDDRFKAAVPVYGCGFLHEHSVWLDRFAKMTPDQARRWVSLWDPSRYVGTAAMPMFFINGTNDFAYWLESYRKTYDLVKSPCNYRITVRMPHGHKAGWAPMEIGLFVDRYLRNGAPLPEITNPRVKNGTFTAQVSSETKLVSAGFYHTSDDALNPDRVWESTPAVLSDGLITATVPPGTKICLVTVTDSRNAVVSSRLVFPK